MKTIVFTAVLTAITKFAEQNFSEEEIKKEMQEIAKTGLQEILFLTGESRKMSDVEYIGNACKIAKKYFKVVGVEVYPMNSDEYAHLHKCGADFVTVFQETYNERQIRNMHLEGHKRIFPYRFYAQERAILGGMRGVGFAALFGIGRFQKRRFRNWYARIFVAEEISVCGNCVFVSAFKTDYK